jgi:hypothetical protein
VNDRNSLLNELEPEVVKRIDLSARDALVKYRSHMTTASVSTLLAVASTEAFGAELPQQVVDILNYALTLEHFEAAFYKTANGADSLIPEKYRGLFREIGEHEAGHVALLSGVLGNAAESMPTCLLTLRRSRHYHPPSKILASRPLRDRLRISPERPFYRPRFKFIRLKLVMPDRCVCWWVSRVQMGHSIRP